MFTTAILVPRFTLAGRSFRVARRNMKYSELPSLESHVIFKVTFSHAVSGRKSRVCCAIDEPTSAI